MNEKQWQQFFDLLDTIVNMPGTYNDKTNKVKEEAENCGESAEMALEEFTSWDFGY